MSDVEEPQVESKNASILSIPRIDRAIRKAFPSKRVSAGSAVYATAAIELILNEVVYSAENKRVGIKRGPKAIDRKILIAAVRTNPELGKLFRSYAFSAEKSIRVKNDALLTKSDKESAMAKRLAEKAQKAEKAAVPAVDED